MYSQFRIPNIWREMDQLQREMSRLLDITQTSRGLRSLSFPAINIWTKEDGQLITAEMPGISPDDIEINVTADRLTISGEKQPESSDESARYHRNERRYGKFKRSIQLPFMVNPDKVDARLKDGILELKLIKAESEQPKKISVKAGKAK